MLNFEVQEKISLRSVMKWFLFLFPWCWNVVEDDRQWTWTGTKLNMTSQIQWTDKVWPCNSTQWNPSERHTCTFDLCNINVHYAWSLLHRANYPDMHWWVPNMGQLQSYIKINTMLTRKHQILPHACIVAYIMTVCIALISNHNAFYILLLVPKRHWIRPRQINFLFNGTPGEWSRVGR